MKYLILLLTGIAAACQACAQVPAASVAQLMKNRMYSCYEVEYNAVLIAPVLYNSNKTDTLDALITFWKYHCTPNERLFSLSTLNAIRNKTFKENVSQNDFLSPRMKPSFTDADIYRQSILPYLKEYKDACKGAFSDTQYKEWLQGNYALPKDYTDYYTFYKQYYAFLQGMAKSLIGKRAYTPVEDFLLRFYSQPDSTRLTGLDSAIYDGTVLKEQYQAFKKYRDQIHGVSTGIEAGTWMPQGPLAILGNHPYTSLRIGGRTEHLIVDYVIGLRYVNSPDNFKVKKDDSVYNSKDFLSWYMGLDFGLKLFRTRKSELDVLWGFGYEEIQVLFIVPPGDDNGDKTISKSVSALNLNAGLAYRFYVRNKMIRNKQRFNYFSLQAKYNYTNYNNEGGTNLLGGALSIGLVYGGFSHTYTKYPYMD